MQNWNISEFNINISYFCRIFHAELEKCSAKNSLHLMWNEMLTKFYQYFAWCAFDKEPNQRPKYCQVALPLFFRTPFLDPSQAKFLNVKQEVLWCYGKIYIRLKLK